MFANDNLHPSENRNVWSRSGFIGNSFHLHLTILVEKQRMPATASTYDRASEIKAFDETKSGVKGLVDTGVTTIPRFFHQPPDSHPVSTSAGVQIPVIDLQGAVADRRRRDEIVSNVRRASETLGFFQVTNHGVPAEVTNEMLEGVRRFHAQPVEVRREFYTREIGRKVSYTSNFDLFEAPAANWRDSMFCVMAPDAPQPEELPAVCREITFKYSNYMKTLGSLIFELLSEAIGLAPTHLESLECSKGHALVANYYPSCPEPHLTLGTSRHSDPDFLTILLQEQIKGLQVFYQNQWIEVPPIPGALVVNIGDLLQLISNDKLKSVEHRVLANRAGPRISVACFFTMHLNPCSRIYGPIEELVSDESPPLYRGTLIKEYAAYYSSKGLDGKSALTHFRL